MQGSLSGFSYAPSEGLLENLSAEEKIELQTFIKKDRQAIQEIERQIDCDQVAQHIAIAAENLQNRAATINQAQAAEIWSAIAAMQKALKASGHPKPAKTPPADVRFFRRYSWTNATRSPLKNRFGFVQ